MICSTVSFEFRVERRLGMTPGCAAAPRRKSQEMCTGWMDPRPQRRILRTSTCVRRRSAGGEGTGRSDQARRQVRQCSGRLKGTLSPCHRGEGPRRLGFRRQDHDDHSREDDRARGLCPHDRIRPVQRRSPPSWGKQHHAGIGQGPGIGRLIGGEHDCLDCQSAHRAQHTYPSEAIG